MISAAVVAALETVIICILLVVHYLERKDLYNRLMAKDLQDYNMIANVKNRPPPKSRNLIRAGLERYYQRKLGD